MTFIESYYQQCTKGFSYYKNHYAKVTIISSQNKSFLAHNWILLTSPTARYKIILLYFTTFSSNKNLFLSALRASRNKFNYDSCKTFILAFDYYHLRIIIIIRCPRKYQGKTKKLKESSQGQELIWSTCIRSIGTWKHKK